MKNLETKPLGFEEATEPSENTRKESMGTDHRPLVPQLDC